MISLVAVQGYKSIKNQQIELKPLNVLIGGNGVGKSNFISIFSLIRNLYEGNLQNYVVRKGGANTFLHLGDKVTQEVVIGIQFDDVNRFYFTLQKSDYSLFIKNVGTSFKASNGWHDANFEQNVLETTFRYSKKRQAFYVNDLLKEFEVYHFHDTGDTSPMKSQSNINDNFALKRDGSNLSAFLYFLKLMHNKHFLRIERTVKSIAPFFEKFQLEPNRLDTNTILLEWQEKGNYDSYFNAHNLSDGTLRFICLATLLLQPTPPKTIIIDEPELGLHPIAINKLCGLFRKKSEEGTQIIISTQSVTLLNNFNAEDIIVADRNEYETVFKRLNDDELSRWTSEYSLGEIWEKNIFGGQPF